MPRVPVGDIHLHYDGHGAGAPLLLIAGFGASSAAWRPEFVTALADAFRVVTFDNRGTGRSDSSETPLSIAQMAGDAAGLLDALGIARAHVMGVSLGGYIAQELALTQPEKVAGLVLGCTHCGPPVRLPVDRSVFDPVMDPNASDPREAFRQLWPAMYPQEFIAANRDVLEALLDRAAAQPTPLATRRRQLDAITPWYSHDRLDRLAAPTLVLTGDRDVMVVPENARILHERIAGSRLYIIEGAGHAFWNSHPDEAAGAVTQFLASVDAPAGA